MNKPDLTFGVIKPRPQNDNLFFECKINDSSELALRSCGATGYTYVATITNGCQLSKDLKQRVTQNAAALSKLCDLLEGSNAPRPTDSEHTSTDTGDTIAVGPESFLARPEFSDAVRDENMTVAYTKVNVKFWNGFQSCQYLNIRSSDIRGQIYEVACAGRYTNIEIKTGICLFSRSLVNAAFCQAQVDAYTEELPPEVIDTTPTIYELEIIARISATVADVLRLIATLSSNQDCTVCVGVDIPDVQYYWTACDSLITGAVTAKYAQKWIANVDCRRKRLWSIISSMIRLATMDRGLEPVKIQISSGSEAAASVVRTGTAAGKPPSVSDIVATLTSIGNEAGRWKSFFSQFDGCSTVLSTTELGRLIHIFETVKGTLAADGTGVERREKPCSHLIIQIDDITEWKIFSEAKAFLRRQRNCSGPTQSRTSIVGLFPLQRIFTACKGRSDLYNKELGDATLSACDKLAITEIDMIGKTYGAKVAERLQRLCRPESLSSCS